MRPFPTSVKLVGLLLAAIVLLILAACTAPPPAPAVEPSLQDPSQGPAALGEPVAPAEAGGGEAPSAAPAESQTTPHPTPAMVLPVIIGSSQGVQPTPTLQPGVLLQIFRADGGVVSLGQAEFQILPQTQLTLNSGVVQGVRVVDLVGIAGVADFSQLTFTSAGGAFALSREQLTDQILLAGWESGALALTDVQRPNELWLQNVTQIQVE